MMRRWLQTLPPVIAKRRLRAFVLGDVLLPLYALVVRADQFAEDRRDDKNNEEQENIFHD